MVSIGSRVSRLWNAFTEEEENRSQPFNSDFGSSFGVRPDRPTLRIVNDRSIVTSIYTRIAVDVAAMSMRHIRLDENDRFQENIDSQLQNILTVEANLDQNYRDLRQNAVMTMLDKGVAAIVPITATANPGATDSWEPKTVRVGEVVAWYPRHVRVSIWNEDRQRFDEVTLEKRYVAIVPNPFFAIMNAPNSTLQRLIRKLSLLDTADEQASSGKLDMIIQLPYTVRSDKRKEEANQRRTDIEFQLKGSQYGIAYADVNEKITQLNRPAENNLLKQIEYLTNQVYGQLGITEGVMNGTATEAEMLNYYNRTIEPILDGFSSELSRKFLSKTARTQKQTVAFFRDPFKLVPVSSLAEIADKFTRNEILTGNEVRSFMGIPPSDDPKADKLQNSNVPAPSEPAIPTPPTTEEGDSQNGS